MTSVRFRPDAAHAMTLFGIWRRGAHVMASFGFRPEGAHVMNAKPLRPVAVRLDATARPWSAFHEMSSTALAARTLLQGDLL
jgi:hypothetical protein